MNTLKQLLSFDDAAVLLHCQPDDVRALVIEEKRLPAVLVTLMGHREPYGSQIIQADAGGRAFDMSDGLAYRKQQGLPPTNLGRPGDLSNHCGHLRVERSVLRKFIEANPDVAHDVHGLLNQLDEKPLSTRERRTLLTIIAVLCKEAKLDYTKYAKTANLIQDMADKMGASIGETTIEGHLKKIADALRTRKK